MVQSLIWCALIWSGGCLLCPRPSHGSSRDPWFAFVAELERCRLRKWLIQPCHCPLLLCPELVYFPVVLLASSFESSLGFTQVILPTAHSICRESCRLLPVSHVVCSTSSLLPTRYLHCKNIDWTWFCCTIPNSQYSSCSSPVHLLVTFHADFYDVFQVAPISNLLDSFVDWCTPVSIKLSDTKCGSFVSLPIVSSNICFHFLSRVIVYMHVHWLLWDMEGRDPLQGSYQTLDHPFP